MSDRPGYSSVFFPASDDVLVCLFSIEVQGRCMFILAEYFRCTYLATTEKEVTNQNFLHYLLSFAISKINRIPSKHRVFLPKLALLKAFWALLATSPIYRTQQLVEKLTLASN